MTDEILSETFRAVGKEYGFDDVNAEFAAFKEFKIKWQRSRGRADFKVSDYLKGAGQGVTEGIARSLFSKISGRDTGYPEEMSDWVTSDAFVRNKQPIYLRRSRNLTLSTKGEARDLVDPCRRLKEAGLIEEDPDVHITWTAEPNVRRVGYCSVLMKVIAISSVFDNAMIPEFVLDYVVYHEFLHIMAGFDPFGKRHGPDFLKEERKFPRREEAEDWLKKLRLYL
jgi:hypothetical protein